MQQIKKLSISGLPLLHSGKVRDSFGVDEQRRLIALSDRISAFNLKIKTAIPEKGAILNSLANFWMQQTQQIIPNHFLAQIDPNLTLVKEAKSFKIELVVRAYLTGSIWRAYAEGKRLFSGLELPDGLCKNQAFEQPILTPTAKTENDEEMSPAEIIAAGLATAEEWDYLAEKALALFAFGQQYLAPKGILLVDTKYEFGKIGDQIILIDEIHTPDSSRFWRQADYEKDPLIVEQLDKEFLRQWMLANKIEGQLPQELPESVAQETSRRYREIYECILGERWSPSSEEPAQRMAKNLLKAGLVKQLPTVELN